MALTQIPHSAELLLSAERYMKLFHTATEDNR
jgi:hypothetical protein